MTTVRMLVITCAWFITGCQSAAPDDESDANGGAQNSVVSVDPDTTPNEPETPDALFADSGSNRVCDTVGLSECFRGVTFADCGGAGPPVAACHDTSSAHGRECLWFSGCIASGFADICDTVEITGGLSEPVCPIGDAATGWGDQPWTRDSFMTLTLAISSEAEILPGRVACGPCRHDGSAEAPSGWPESQCFAAGSICDRGEPVDVGQVRFPNAAAEWGLPSLVSIVLVALPIGDSEHQVVVELDFDRSLGRLCVVQSTDTPTAPGLPVCAEAGRVDVNLRVDEAGDVEALHGSFEAEFGKYSAVPGFSPFVEGLAIRGTF